MFSIRQKISIYFLSSLFAWFVYCCLMRWQPDPFANPILRAVVRIAVLLVPAFVYWRREVCQNAEVVKDVESANTRSDFFKFTSNLGLGMVIGFILSMLFAAMICLQHRTALDFKLPIGFALWLNYIVGSPLVEELFFRGVVAQEAARGGKKWQAILLSALLFAVFHLPWWIVSGEKSATEIAVASCSIFIYGIVFGAAFLYSRSIWGSLLPHWLNNLLLLSLK